MNIQKYFGIVCCLMAIGFYAGCDNSNTDDHDHDHDGHGHGDHDHGDHGDHGHGVHVHGPNDGEVYEAHGYRFEVAVDGDKLMIVFLEDEGMAEKLVKVDMVEAVQTKGRDKQEFELKPTNADDDGMASKFELEDEKLGMVYQAFGFDMHIHSGEEHKDFTVPKNPH